MGAGAGVPHNSGAVMPNPKHTRTTSDEPLWRKSERVITAFSDPRNHLRSNRELAVELSVDESTVRRYRRLLKIPRLLPGIGVPEKSVSKKRRKKK
jgi:hypothetical protein